MAKTLNLIRYGLLVQGEPLTRSQEHVYAELKLSFHFHIILIVDIGELA